MKKTLLTSVALGMLAGAAFAEGQEPIVKNECSAIFPFSLFEETSSGDNCPATATEKGVGEVIFLGTVFVIGVEAIGGDVFPFNEGVFSGL